MPIRFACSWSEFKFWTSLLIFCLIDLSNVDSGVLNSLTIIVWKSKSLCKSLELALCIWVLQYWVYILLQFLALLVVLILLPLCNVLFVSFDVCCFKVYFIRDENCNSCFFFPALCLLGNSSSIPLF